MLAVVEVLVKLHTPHCLGLPIHIGYLVHREKKSSHLKPLLKQLHWFPIEYRIKYKIILIVYKCLHEMGPVYLSSLLTGYHPKTSMCLRSDKEELLDNKRTAKGYGDRAFAKSGPELWNALPLDILECDSFQIIH